MEYTRIEIYKLLETAAEAPHKLYRQALINYRGETKDTHEPYTEVISDWLLSNTEVLTAIQSIHRMPSYRVVGHDGLYQPGSNRKEEQIAMDMFRFCAEGGTYEHIGKIIDYQTPLKGKKDDEAGKIDLLAYDGKNLRILELKEPDSTETMLRCVLEGFTYLSMVDTVKLIHDFELPASTKVTACPFVFYGGEQYKEMLENRPMLRKLMQLLHSVPLYIKHDNDKYIVTEE